MLKLIGTVAVLLAAVFMASGSLSGVERARAKVVSALVLQDNACVALEAAGAATPDDANALLFSCTDPMNIGGGGAVVINSRLVPNLDIIAAVASQPNDEEDQFDVPAGYEACNDIVDPDTGELAVDDINELVCSLDLRDGVIDGNFTLRPEDFAGIDLDLNQLHAHDGRLFVVAFVDDESVDMAMKTSVGTWEGSPSKIWLCFSQGRDQDSAVAGVQVDKDCDGAPGIGDGAVVAHLRAHGAADPAAAEEPRGPGTVLVAQEGLALPVPITVVGEPHDLKLQTFETSIQVGLTQDDCPLGGKASDFVDALGRPDKTIMLAKVLDDEGVEITGAFLSYASSDEDKLLVASALSASLDLGSFGAGGPDIFCGAKKTGDATVTVHLLDAPGLAAEFGISPERDARADVAEAVYKVTGKPASITLAAAPAVVQCDGTATAEISATVSDGDGNPVENGTPVTFDVSVLGTANPIIAKVGAGVAKSAVTPLAASNTGVPVIVTAGDVQASIIVTCGPGSAPPSPGQPGSGAGAGTGTPTGTITGPDTGNGGYLGYPDGFAFPFEQMLIVATAIAISFGTRTVLGRLRRRA